jgi:hypothetical protein
MRETRERATNRLGRKKMQSTHLRMREGKSIDITRETAGMEPEQIARFLIERRQKGSSAVRLRQKIHADIKRRERALLLH